ncbi:MAG: hypothetical protein R3B68_01505 [Phycisphaerales bacterium]
MPFTFTLQPVLDQRLRQEREHQRRVAELERERLTLEGEIAAQQRAIEQERDDLRAALFHERSAEQRGGQSAERLHLPALRHGASATLGLISRAQRAVVRLAGVHQRLDAARLELINATAARRGVEVLRERRYEAWKREQERAEAAALDELAVMRAARAEQPGDGPDLASN